MALLLLPLLVPLGPGRGLPGRAAALLLPLETPPTEAFSLSLAILSPLLLLLLLVLQALFLDTGHGLH